MKFILCIFHKILQNKAYKIYTGCILISHFCGTLCWVYFFSGHSVYTEQCEMNQQTMTKTSSYDRHSGKLRLLVSLISLWQWQCYYCCCFCYFCHSKVVTSGTI